MPKISVKELSEIRISEKRILYLTFSHAFNFAGWKPFITVCVSAAVIPGLLLNWIFLEFFFHLNKFFNFLHLEATRPDK